MPSQAELDSFYRSGGYYDKAEVERERVLKEARVRVMKLHRLSEQFGLTRRLLDVGCASGYFLKQACANGWNAIGLDRSEDLAQKARERSGAMVVSGLLEEAELEQGPYPVVTAWEVVEHTVDPRAFFGALARQVAPGGLLALSTPLANGIPARMLGTNFPMLIPPEHLRLFTRQSINLLAREFGFAEVSYRSFSNLKAPSLAAGLAKVFFRRSRGEASAVVRTFCDGAGLALAWVPMLIDWAGWGTEMEIVFKRTSAVAA